MDIDRKPKINRRITIFAILLSLISIGILVFGFIIVSSDKVVMLQSISNLYNKANGILEDDFVLIDKISSSKNIEIKTKNTINLGEKKFKINANYIENSDNKKNSLDLDIVYDLEENQEKEVENDLEKDKNYSIKLLLDNNKLFSSIDKENNNFYSFDFKYFNALRSLSSNDYDSVLSLIKEAFDDSITNKDIRKEKVTITYNGKDKKVNKLTYVINTSELKEIAGKFIDSIRKDKSLFNNICDVLNINKKDFNKYLDDYLSNLDKVGNKDFYSYSTYYYGFNKIVKYELYSYDKDLSLTYKTEKDDSVISLDNRDNNIFNIVIKKNKNGKYKFSGKFVDRKTVVREENGYDFSNSKYYNVTGTYKDGDLKLNINNDEIKYEIISKNIPNTIDAIFKYSLQVNIYNVIPDAEDEVVLKLKSDIEISFDKKVDLEIKDSIDYNSLPEEEQKLLLDDMINPDLEELLKIFDIKFLEENN